MDNETPMKRDQSVYVLLIMCPLAASGRGPSLQAPAEMVSSSGWASLLRTWTSWEAQKENKAEIPME